MISKIFTVFFCTLFVVFTANGAVKTWDGGGADTNWMTAANWVGDIAPIANDDLVFPNSATAATINNNFFFFTTFRSITFQGGTYTISGNPLNVTAGVTVDSGTQTINTIIGLSGGSQTFLHGQGSLTTYAAISLGANNLTFDGLGNAGIGVISGSGQFIKNGSGSALIASASSFSGSYTTNAGILVIDANTPNSTVTVNGGAVGGTGTVANVTVNAGAVSAGTLQSPTGIFNTKDLLLTNQGAVAIKIGGTTPGSTGHDQINVTGTVSLGGSSLAPIAWNGFRPALNDSFVIINNDGTDAVNGTFANLPEGGRLAALGFAFKVSYIGSTGNDVVITRTNLAPYDFDGDGKSDISTYTPSNGVWREFLSNSSSIAAQQFGISTDKLAPVDFDGDTKADVAVFRGSTGDWYYMRSSDNTVVIQHFGQSGDIPVPNDFDGDGRADLAVFRPSEGVWYEMRSLGNQFYAQQFGSNGDKPLMGDYDGDGIGDIAVYRPSTGVWYVWQSSTNTFTANAFGNPTDTPVPADYDGDGKTDRAVFRPSSTENVPDFYVSRSSDNTLQGSAWGIPNDIPVVGDYDGDGKADVAVFRPSTNTWYLLQTTNGFSASTFGANGDVPVPSAFN